MPEISRFFPRARALVLEWALLHRLEGGTPRTPPPHPSPGVRVMDYHIVEARHVGGYVVWLRFSDGKSGEVDLSRELHGPVFEPLRDLSAFKRFRLDPEFHTLVWPNGADLAPELLHAAVRVTA